MRSIGRHPFPRHGLAGLAIILLAEMMLFQGVEWVATFFTAIVWTGYILLMDALVYRLKGCSLLRDGRRELFFLAPFSIVFWLVFELYNFHLKNWTYINLPDPLWLRWFGYAWAFATILPALFLTASWIEATGVFARLRIRPRAISPYTLRCSIITGAGFCAIPALAPPQAAPYLFAFVWMGFALLFDPINYMAGRPSLFRDLEEGTMTRFACFFAAGLLCGVLWEFWNYWAHAKWVYTVPIMQNLKVFEMPLVGYLGFPAFAYECFVVTTFVRSMLRVETIDERGIHDRGAIGQPG